jgi:hypothetical protein
LPLIKTRGISPIGSLLFLMQFLILMIEEKYTFLGVALLGSTINLMYLKTKGVLRSQSSNLVNSDLFSEIE